MPQNPNDELWDPRPRLEPAPESELEAADAVPDVAGAVLVELAGSPGMSPVAALDVARRLEVPGFTLDEEWGVTSLGEAPESETYVVRGHVSEDAVVVDLEQDPLVVKVWRDTPVEHF